MTVVALSQIADRSGTHAEGNKHSYRLNWIVQTDNNQDDAGVVLNTLGLPRIGATYATGSTIDLAAVCLNLTAEQADNEPRIWLVTAEYGEPQDQKDTASENKPENPDTQEDPELRPPEVSISAQEQEIPVSQITAYSDINRTTAANVEATNGEPFDPEPTLSQGRPIIRLKWTRKRLRLKDTLETYDSHVNRDTWNGFPRNTLLAKFAGAEPYYERRKLYWRICWDLHYNPNTWNLTLINNGTWELVGGSPRIITDAQGNAGVRRMLTAASAVTTGPPYYLTFYVYPQCDFDIFDPDIRLD